MDVLHIMPCVSRSYGGPTQSLVGYAQAARTAGLDVTVAAPKPPPEDARWLHEQLPDATSRLFDSVGSGAFSVSPALFRWLWQAGDDYDVVHTHGLFNPTSSGAARLGTGRGWPLVLRPFGTLSHYTFSRRTMLKRLYFRGVDRPSVRSASGLHFTTAAERDEAARLDVDFEHRAFVAPPPFRGEYGGAAAKATTPTALFLSRLHPKKNISGLLSAWQRVLEEVPDAHLVIAGTGRDAYVEDRKQQAATLGLQDHVSFVGFVQGAEKQKLLASSHVFVLPSHQENFGVAVLEAVAAGLPVVISPEVQLASFIEAQQLGHVVERDPAPVGEALAQTLRDDVLQRRCAEEGPRLVEEHFSPEEVGTQLQEMYAQVRP